MTNLHLNISRRHTLSGRCLSAGIAAALCWQIVTDTSLAAEPTELTAGATNDIPSAVRVYQITQEQFGVLEPLLRDNGFKPVTNSAAIGIPTSANIDTNALPRVLQEPTPTDTTGSESHDHTMSTSGPTPVDGQHFIPAPQRPIRSSNHSSCDAVTSDEFGRLIVDLFNTDWSSGDAAIVVFVIVSAIVVLTVVVYAGVYLYEIVTGRGDYEHWLNIEPRVSVLYGRSGSGYFAGLTVAAGFESEQTRTGALLEAGYMNLRVRPEESDGRIRAEGAYIMAGTGVNWLFGKTDNPSLFGLELLAGTADDPDVKLMSVARANLNFGLGTYGRFGVSLGSLLIGLEAGDGLLKDHNLFVPLLGFETGFRF